MTKFLRKNGEKGFTLIELLVVVAIIGILVAIAIPQFAAYKKQAANSTAKAQLRTLAVAMESYFVAESTYVAADLAATKNLEATYGYASSNGVVATLGSPNAITATTWSAVAYATAGDTTYTWDSTAGGLQ